MTTMKAILLAVLMTCVFSAALPLSAQDTDTASSTEEGTADASPSSAPAPPTDASAEATPNDGNSAVDGAEQPTSATTESSPAISKSADAASKQPPMANDTGAPEADRKITVELAGPSTTAPPTRTAPGASADATKETQPSPVSQNPFIALGDEMFLGTMLISAWGIHFWDWFEQSFHFEREYGFTQKSSTGGADKTGHFFTAYVFADFLNWRLRRQGWSKLRSTIVGSSVAMGLMTWIEVGDATSAYGWSWEDILADFIGVAISAGLSLSPTVDELFDFRLEYWPTKSYMDGGVMAADYSGMKYLMALRMTGIKPLKQTPLRFLEFHLGYYSRGFRSFDKTKDTNRVVYFGIGLDLKEILNKYIPKKYMRPFDVALTYYQPPYTSWEVKAWEHPGTRATRAATPPATQPTQP